MTEWWWEVHVRVPDEEEDHTESNRHDSPIRPEVTELEPKEEVGQDQPWTGTVGGAAHTLHG